jgi:tRNA(His) 5'-end guanylyltransferase
MEKPFDNVFIDMMNTIGLKLCDEIQNCKLAYLQSDEISFLVYNGICSTTWFGNDIQKMCSVSASLASAVGTKYIFDNIPRKSKSIISFDSRAFIMPPKEVANYFLWRQQDWERNSLQMFARKYYSQKDMQNKNCEDMHEMLHDKADNWNNLPSYLKRGRCIVKKPEVVSINNDYFEGKVMRNKWTVDLETPIFKENRDYILSRLEDNNDDGNNVHYIRSYLENEEKAQKGVESETDKCDSCFEYQTKGLSACYEGCKDGV